MVFGKPGIKAGDYMLVILFQIVHQGIVDEGLAEPKSLTSISNHGLLAVLSSFSKSGMTTSGTIFFTSIG